MRNSAMFLVSICRRRGQHTPALWHGECHLRSQALWHGERELNGDLTCARLVLAIQFPSPQAVYELHKLLSCEPGPQKVGVDMGVLHLLHDVQF